MEVGGSKRGRRVNSHEYEERSIPGVLQSCGSCYRLQPHLTRTVHKPKKELPTRVKEWPFLWVRTIFIDMGICIKVALT